MEFEIHLTVDCEKEYYNHFRNVCKKIGVKPIIIDTQNNDYNQIMTSSKHIDSNPIYFLNKISFFLKKEGFKILRKKVEKKPENIKDINFIYYESHLRLKLPLDFDLSKLNIFCSNFNLHKSKNLFKKESEIKYQMLTYRDFSINLDKFLLHIDNICLNLKRNDIIFDKVEVEECILDTNINIDKNWLYGK